MMILTRIKPLYFLLFCIFFLSFESIAQQDSTSQKQTGVNIIVTQSPKIIVKLEAVTHNVCNGESKGAINISASGGYPPYKYYWSNGEKTQDIAAIKAGVYKVAVYDNFSCSDTLEVVVEEPKPLLADIDNIKDILCYGYDNGAVEISVQGGVEPYKYSWNTGATTEDLTGVNSGRYSVLITDANQCQEILTADVQEKPLIVRTLDDESNILCQGDSTGQITLSVSGGVAPYTYQWDHGATEKDLSGLTAGEYQVTVKDAVGCTEVSLTTVAEPKPLEIGFDEIRNLRCNGDFGGAININVTGGTQPYQYQWSNGKTMQDIAGIPAGSYSVQVTDKNGCENSIETTLTQPLPLTAKLIKAQNVRHYQGEDGSIDIEVSGGVAPYKFKWSNDKETQNLRGLKAGSYSVRITDAIGCAKILNVTLTQPEPMVVRIYKTQNIACHGDNTGEISVSVIGGVSPYSYQWSSGQTVQDLTQVKAGNYSVVVTDANGHKKQADTVLTEPPAFQASLISAKNIDCHGEYSGGVDIDVAGGVPPYKYRWSNGDNNQDLKNVPAGKYSVKITDANLCEQILEATVTEPEPLQINILKIENINCFGENSGSVDIAVTGGKEPYIFNWSNEATTEDLAGVKAGNYMVTVTDANGCRRQANAEVTEPQLLVVEEDKSNNVDCFGNSTGAISLNVSGGVTPYAYKWNSGQTTKDIEDLVAGEYNVVVTDANGCTKSLSKKITQPDKLVRALHEVTNILCYGDAKGAINIDVNGGVTPYQYKWSNGAISQDIVGVKAGEYNVEIFDANGCRDTLSAVVAQNELLVPKVDVTSINCNGLLQGAVNLTVQGGVKPYKYAWSNGAETEDITKLPAGNYSVMVTDAKGCSKTIDAQIMEPPLFVASLESDNDILCNSENTGNVNIRVSGGTKPYKFVWNNGASTQNLSNVKAGFYELKATDAKGCLQTVTTTITEPSAIVQSVKSVTNVLCHGNEEGAIDVSVIGGVGPYQYKWNNGAATQDLEAVPAGKYSLKLRDAHGCVKTLDAEITQPDLLNLTLDNIEHILCHGDLKGKIDVTVAGGVKPYAYSWSNGSTTEDIGELPAGSYTLTVTDANGCAQTLTAAVKQPPLLRARIAKTKQILCNGATNGAVSVEVAGGSKPYKFNWSNGNTSQNLLDVGAGTYTLNIEDANGCTQTLKAVINEPSKLISSLVNTKNVSCFNGTDGYVNIAVKGGVAPYQYKWSNGATTQDLTDIPHGNYAVGISDANGCRDSVPAVQISHPPLLEVEVVDVKHVLINGDKAGAIDISVKGGVTPYQYSWSNGATTEDIGKVPGGDYSANVMDANGCEKKVIATINQPPPLVISLDHVKDILCHGDALGAIDISVTGGAPPYAFSWSNGASTQNISSIEAGEYTVTVKDQNGNEKRLSTTVAEPTPLIVSKDFIENINCFQDNTGSINVTVTGGIEPYQYEWNTGAKTQDISGLKAGEYTLTVTDGNQCQKTFNQIITEPALFTAEISETSHVKCKGIDEGAVKLHVNGGVTPYSYYWSNGEKTKDITGVHAGEYEVTITDANGCTNELHVNITEPSELLASVENVTNNRCFGEQKGAISLGVEGGTSPYSFEWNNGSTSQNLTNLPKGDYEVNVKDANGCSKILTANISEPNGLIATLLDKDDVKCAGDKTGKLLVGIEGGIKPYSYIWNSGQTTKDISEVPAGKYQLAVTDKNDCKTTLDTVIEQPGPLMISKDTVHNIICYGDSKGFVDINVKGGVYPYEYKWSNGAVSEDIVNVMAGSYQVRVNDANGCEQTFTTAIKQPERLIIELDSLVNNECSGKQNGSISISAKGGVAPYEYYWNDGQKTPGIKNLAAGRYVATLTDANGCITNYSAEITQPYELVKSIDAITDVRCHGEETGSINVTVMGGVQPYSFEWNNGATSRDIHQVAAGAYSLKIKEGNGCESTLSAVIEEPPPFLASVGKVTDVACFGYERGAIDIDVKGGIEPYQFTWSNGAETQNLRNIGADSYAAMITDANGCIKTVNAEVSEPPLLELRIDSVKNVKCCGDNSGAIYISVHGGVAPYDYQWSNGAKTQDIENLVLGVYTVNVTDANGCIVSTPDNMTLYEQVVSKGKFTTRDINFDVSKSTIKPESFTTINRIATFMKEHPGISFRIDGHTDSDGSDAFNQKLSEDRSEAIKRALIKFGIRESRLESKGWGESKPIASNVTKEGKALNRRVEFIALTGTLEGTLIENEENIIPEQ
ncbi:MAG: OmpA family protein [Cytophagales bacterium]|nr:OmpA family protein [Cytophagales bacterium]